MRKSDWPTFVQVPFDKNVPSTVTLESMLVHNVG